MDEPETIDPTAGVPHPPDIETKEVSIEHPETGEEHTIHIPADHNGSRVKVEFPDGTTAYTEGWDPVERALAGERPVVPCGTCGEPQVLTATEFDCSACGAHNRIVLQTSSDAGTSQEAHRTE